MFRKSPKRMYFVLAAVILLALLTLQGASAKGKPLFLFLSYADTGLSRGEFIGAAHQLAGLLGDQLGEKVVAIVPPGTSIESNELVVQAVEEGRADIAGLHAFAYLIAHDTANAEVIVNTTVFGQVTYQSQFMTHNETGYVELSDLEGVDLCWPDPSSISGYIIPSLMLEAAGVTPGAGSYFVGSHPGVAQAIYDKECDAGASYVDVRASLAGTYPDVYDVVLVMEESPLIPNSNVFSVAESVSAERQAAITAALLAIAGDSAGASLLEQLGYTAIVQTDHSIFVGLEDLIAAAGLTPQEFWDTYLK